MKHLSTAPPLFLLLALVCFASVGAVIYTPGLPQMVQDLNISFADAQLSMAIYLIGCAFGGLPYGPLSNYWGRKPTLRLGISIAIMGSVLILLASYLKLYGLLLVGRLLMAMGASVGITLVFAMIGDCFNGKKAAHTFAHMSLSFAIGPSLSVAIGGVLTQYFNWNATFVFFLFYAFALLFLTRLLPETAPCLDKAALKWGHIKKGYWTALTHKVTFFGAVVMGCSTAVIYLFAANAPFIAIDILGMNPMSYGSFNFLPPLGMICGSFLSRRLSRRFSSLELVLAGCWLMMGLSFLMLMLAVGVSASPWTLFLPIPFLYIGTTIVYTNATAIVMSHALNKSITSAFMNVINLGVAMLVVSLQGTLYASPLYSVPSVFFALALIIFLLTSKILKKETPSSSQRF